MKRHTFLFDKDLEVSMEKLVQKYTYDGLLEGLPGEIVNRMVLNNLEQSAKNDLHQEEIHILLPRAMNEEFPPVVCIAYMECLAVFKNSKKNYSSLGVIWFQDDFAFPIETAVLEQFKSIPFRKLCGEFEY
ncbi:MAG: hypothetical protein ACO1N0_03930 [Fluviicola sp.]